MVRERKSNPPTRTETRSNSGFDQIHSAGTRSTRSDVTFLIGCLSPASSSMSEQVQLELCSSGSEQQLSGLPLSIGQSKHPACGVDGSSATCPFCPTHKTSPRAGATPTKRAATRQSQVVSLCTEALNTMGGG